MTSRKKRIVAGVAVAVVLAGVVAASVVRDRKSKVAVQTQKAERRDLVSKVSASGEVKPKRFVNVSANVSGRIVLLLVKEGEPVRRGQVLAKIDSARIEAGTRQSEAGLEAARAELQRAEADLEAARLAFERTRAMHDQKLVSDADFDQADAELKVRRAMVEAQRKRILQQAAAVASDRDDLEKTTVVSPMDGVVTNLEKEEGEVVIGAQSFSPTVIMTVADLSVMEVEVLVDETDIRNVTLGQTADVRVDALEGVKIVGTVTEIGASAIPRGQGQGAPTSAPASTGNQAKDFKVSVTLEAPPAALRPGLNATADITTAEKKGVLAVPLQAVVVREVSAMGAVIDPGGLQAAEGEPVPAKTAKGQEKEGVFVVGKGQAQFKVVKTGIIGDTDIEVVEGLSPGDEIVTGSYKTLRTLKDKSKIKVEEPKEKK
jgi:HlyD family secretion protein